MKAWLLSVAAVVLLMVLLELLLNEGQMKKYIQGFIRLCLIVTMLLPIVKLTGQDFQFDISQQPGQTIVDENFLTNVHRVRYEQTERKIVEDLGRLGIKGAVVAINLIYFEKGQVGIDIVTVDLNNAVITEMGENILTIDKLKKVVTDRLNITEGQIIIHGDANVQ